jgi:hypothetical protein
LRKVSEKIAWFLRNGFAVSLEDYLVFEEGFRGFLPGKRCGDLYEITVNLTHSPAHRFQLITPMYLTLMVSQVVGLNTVQLQAHHIRTCTHVKLFNQQSAQTISTIQHDPQTLVLIDSWHVFDYPR